MHWHTFWSRKLAAHKARDDRVTVFTRPLRYSSVPKKDDEEHPYSQAREKGIDIRKALDLVRGARLGEYDVALLFSQDDDFKEVHRKFVPSLKSGDADQDSLRFPIRWKPMMARRGQNRLDTL